MTFCFMFIAKHRGGIGIVSDRRISIRTEFDGWVPIDDDAVKFRMLGKDLGVAFAGSLNTISLVLDRFAKITPSKKPSERLSETTQRISTVYCDLIDANPELKAPDESATLVFFDTYRRNSSQRYRLLQLGLGYDLSKKRALVEANYDRGKDWVAIGATHQVRRHLAGCAIPDMQEYARRRIQCRPATKEEIKKFSKQGSTNLGAVTIIQEPGQNPPWRELETYRMLRDFGDARMDYASMLAGVASNAIHYEVKHLKGRGVSEMSTISQEQYTAVFHNAYGLRASSPGFPA